jgi:hypothetical protein
MDTVRVQLGETFYTLRKHPTMRVCRYLSEYFSGMGKTLAAGESREVALNQLPIDAVVEVLRLSAIDTLPDSLDDVLPSQINVAFQSLDLSEVRGFFAPSAIEALAEAVGVLKPTTP